MSQETLGWDTVESSGLMDDFDGTISDETQFGYDAKYGENLVFILAFDDVETEDGEPVRQFYSLGKGWDTNDNGETVFNPANPKGFNKSSNYGMFIESVKATDAMSVLMDRGKTPDDASVWHGLRFHFKRQDVTRKIGDNEPVTSSVLLASEYLGEGEGEEAPKAKAKPKAKDDGAPNEKVMRAKVKKIAKAHDDHDDFVAAVMEELPEVEELDELFAEILDEDSEIFTG